MTVDFTLSDNPNKDIGRKARRIRIDSEPIIWVTLGPRERHGKGLGRFREVLEAFLNDDNRLYFGYRTKDDSGLFRQYAIVGRVLTSKGETLS